VAVVAVVPELHLTVRLGVLLGLSEPALHGQGVASYAPLPNLLCVRLKIRARGAGGEKGRVVLRFGCGRLVNVNLKNGIKRMKRVKRAKRQDGDARTRGKPLVRPQPQPRPHPEQQQERRTTGRSHWPQKYGISKQVFANTM